MKSNNYFSIKSLVMLSLVLAFTLNVNAKENKGNSNKGDKNHSAYVNNNNNGRAGKGNKGNGKGNNPYGNQGNDKKNGRAGGGSGDSVPLDGGLGILLAGAAFYGVKKLRKAN